MVKKNRFSNMINIRFFRFHVHGFKTDILTYWSNKRGCYGSFMIKLVDYRAVRFQPRDPVIIPNF